MRSIKLNTAFLAIYPRRRGQAASAQADPNRRPIQTGPNLLGPEPVWERSVPVHIDSLMVCAGRCRIQTPA